MSSTPATPRPHPLASLPAAILVGLLSAAIPFGLGLAADTQGWVALAVAGAILAVGCAGAGSTAVRSTRVLTFPLASLVTSIATVTIIIALVYGARGVRTDLIVVAGLMAIMLGFPALALCLGAAAIAHATPGARRRRAPPPGFCTKCGYDTRALPAGPCPECGA
jgi:hypothetical protein